MAVNMNDNLPRGAQAVPSFRRLVPDGKISINTNLAPFYVPLTQEQKDIVSCAQSPSGV